MKTVFFALFVLVSGLPALAQQQPYAGQQDRQIASLSEDDVAALLAGQGWGLALPAELNGYPGPIHVLELADMLGLSAEQEAATRMIYERMQAQARSLGAQYVQIESHLSQSFRAGTIDAAQLAHMTEMSGQTLARLRTVHLAAHLEMIELLTPSQIELYADARGYVPGASHDPAAHGAGHKMNH